MAQTETLLDDEQAQDSDTLPAAPKRFSRLRRRDRKGLGTGELVALILVIALVGLLAGLGISRLIGARSGAEHNALQTNIETVESFVDSYWNQFAADELGRRKLDPARLCSYLNSQIAGGEIVLRSLRFVQAGTSGDTAENAPAFAANDPADLAEHIAVGNNRGLETNADCSDWDSNITATADADILVSTAAITAGPPNHDYGTAVNRATLVQDIGLMSTKTVWIAFYEGLDATGGVAAVMPTGTDVDFDNGGTEYVILGGMAPDGTSFCAVKVLDAADGDNVRTWHRSRLPVDGRTFLTCTDGVAATSTNPANNNDWPEPS